MSQCVVPYLSEFMEAAAVEKVCAEFLDKSYMVTQDKAHDEVEEEEGVDLCDCEFSLAYGAKILLNNTRLRLKKGRRYGLCGPNGAGKVCISFFPFFAAHLAPSFCKTTIDNAVAFLLALQSCPCFCFASCLHIWYICC